MERFSTSLLGQASTLLLATDGSHFSDGAIQEAIFFGQACRAKVVVLHAVPVDAESVKAANWAVMKRQQELAPHLDQIRRMALDSGVELEIVVVGSVRPERTIVEQARIRNADAILMGRHGKAARMSLLVGSMTARVIGQGFPRVLVVPKDFLITGANVLVAVDGSPNSRLAAQEALSLGRTCTTLERLTVISVAARGNDLNQAQGLVDDVCGRCRQSGLQAVCEPLVQSGNPAELIVQAARERNADMILIGGRGRRFMPRMFMGGVTEQVIGKAHCAVFVVIG